MAIVPTSRPTRFESPDGVTVCTTSVTVTYYNTECGYAGAGPVVSETGALPPGPPAPYMDCNTDLHGGARVFIQGSARTTQVTISLDGRVVATGSVAVDPFFPSRRFFARHLSASRGAVVFVTDDGVQRSYDLAACIAD